MSNPLNRNIKRGEHLVLAAEYAVHPYTNLLDRVFVAVSGPGMSEKASGSFIDGYFLIGKEQHHARSWHISVEETKEWQHRSHTVPVQGGEYCKKESDMIVKIQPSYLVDVEVDLPQGYPEMRADEEKAIIDTIKTRLHVYHSVREEDIEGVHVVAMAPVRDTVYSIRYRIALHPNSQSSDIKIGGTNMADTEDTYDLVGAMMDWEMGELSDKGQLKLFAYLLNNNLTSGLNGIYGRYARTLLDAGYILEEDGKFVPQYQRLSEEPS